MKQRFLLVLSALLTTALALAGPVSKEEAKSKAAEFMSSRYAASRGTVSTAEPLMVLDRGDYFVFNMGTDDGFVIVCGDDRAPAILAYSDRGTFDAQNIPTNMQAFLQGYADEIQHMPETAAARAEAPKKVVKQTISPLIETIWNQDRPYNNLCPLFLNTTERCVTGCVATAMAQVMFYHKWPDQVAKDIPAYDGGRSWSGYGKIHVDGVAAGSVLDWSKMWLAYPYYKSSVAEASLGADEQAANLAVAQLMAYCGRSISMDYANGSSGGSMGSIYNAAQSLVEYFDYDAGIQYVNRTNYSSAEWTNLLYTELAENRPVLYGGQSSGGGHAFVVDGYEGGYFHVNWGWGGDYDCHVLLSEMNPYNNSGIGASSSDDGYSFLQDAIIHVQKNVGTVVPEEPAVMGTGSIATTGETTLTRGGDGNFTVPMTMATWNLSGSTNTFDIGYGVYDANGNTLQKAFLCATSREYNPTYGDPALSATLSFGDGWADGSYRIVGISRVTGSDTWNKNSVSDSRYLLAVIKANQMRLLTPSVDIKASGISVEGTKKAQSGHTVTATIQNLSTDYNGYLYLFANGKLVGGKIVEVAALGSTTFSIDFYPETAGTYTLKLTTDIAGTTVIGSGSVTIESADVAEEIVFDNKVYADVDASYLTNVDMSTYTVDADKNITVDAYSQNSGVRVRFINNTADAVSKVFVAFAKYNESTHEYNVYSWGTTSYNIPANGQTQWFVYGSSVTNGIGKYEIRLYKNGSVSDENLLDNHFHFELVKGYSEVTATGETKMVKVTGSDATVADDALSAELDATMFADVHPNSNPNTLYVITNGSTPASLSGKNVVDGTKETADKIALSDGNSFETPVDFTAKEITYKRTIATGTDGTGSGWTTIVLPFDVAEVTVGGVAKDWFHSSTDTNKDFWVKKFVDDGAGNVYFDYADKIEAYTPYIIAVPGNKWGAALSLAGKEIVFKGADAHLRSGAKASLLGDEYKFAGTMKTAALTDAYILNAAGSQFAKGAGTVEPFRAYFQSLTPTGVSSLFIVSADETTSIQSLPADIQTPTVYTLDGRRVSGSAKKGVYIINGKKVIK